MKNYRIRYTRPDGEQRVTAVSFDRPSAEERKSRLESDGNTGVEIVIVKPGG